MSGVRYPTGTILYVAGVEPDWDWLECDGRVLNGNDPLYAALFAVIGNRFGGTSISNFRLPDLRGRCAVGVKASTAGTGLSGPVGSWEGASSVLLSGSQTGVPAHGHAVTDPQHSHTPSWNNHAHNVNYIIPAGGWALKGTDSGGYNSFISGGGSVYGTAGAAASISLANTTVSVTINSSTAVAATSSHENRQPSIALTAVIHL